MEPGYDVRRSEIKTWDDVVYHPEKIINDFPIFKNQKSLIYFDNASTTHKPISVINKISEFYSEYNANVHRGSYDIAELATQEYENSRKEISKFINCNSKEIIFTKSTTESINLVSYSLAEHIFNIGDEIIISEMEHHSNIIPWQILAERKKLKLKFIPISKDGKLKINDLNKLITKKTKLLSITHMSNLLGLINPIEKIISIAKKNNILTIIDAAQSISHLKIDVKKLDCDFLVFSGHKILGPTGIGILYGKKELLKAMPPFLGGGHMIKEVTLKKSTWGDIPFKFEAGTPNIAQAIGLSEGIKYFNKMFNTESKQYLNELSYYLNQELLKIKKIKLINQHKGSIVAFNIKNIHPFDLTKLLATKNICIRSGHHCALPLLNKYKLTSINRISLYYYNTKKEIDIFCEKLAEVIDILN